MRRFCGPLVAGLAITILAQGADRALAQSAPEDAPLRFAPLNPAFQKYVNDVRSGHVLGKTASGHALGLVPAPIDLSHLSVNAAGQAARDPALPATYDLRTKGKVSPVGNQNPYGTCWTFATFASMESCLLPGFTANFSENNLANLAGFDRGFGDGGQAFMAAAYLARWSGPILEEDDPYHNVGGSPASKPVQRHVQQIRVLANRDSNGIKRAIMDHGGVWTSIFFDDTSYNESKSTYFYNGTNFGNHAITVVGWDDSYDRNRFKTPASRDGAWIIKNSWGTDWGENGFFYCSYDDTAFGFMVFVFMNAEPSDNYSRIYQHDPLGMISCIGAGPTAWGANMFVSEDTTPTSIGAVSFYTLTTNASYQVFLYTGVSPNAPRSGTLRSTTSGTLAAAGYHTVPLVNPAPLAPSERFSVVVQLNTPGLNFPLAAEFALDGLSSKATAAPGQSFCSMDGLNWKDVTTSTGNTTINLCIKAFASSKSTGIQAARVFPSRDGDSAAIETTAGRAFKLATPAGESTDLFLGHSPSPDEADIRLTYSAPQRTFATLFEGKWMTIGTKAAPKTLGKSVILVEAVSDKDTVQWTFIHKLKAGESCGIYQKRENQWVKTHTVECK